MRLLKLHGLGNDFLIRLDPDGIDLIDGEIARSVCDRHRGIGADGLIHATPAAGVVAKMTLYNADGGRAEISGNGLRCLAFALRRANWTSADEFAIDTDVGRRQVRLVETISPETVRIATEMGDSTLLPSPSAEVLAMLPPHLSAKSVSMGNPHLIVEVEDCEKVDAAVIGAAIDAAIVGGSNVHFVSSAPSGLRMNIYERGVGPTEACGSGACAAAVALGVGSVKVSMLGGDVRVDTGSPVILEGTATWIAECDVTHD